MKYKIINEMVVDTDSIDRVIDKSELVIILNHYVGLLKIKNDTIRIQNKLIKLLEEKNENLQH